MIATYGTNVVGYVRQLRVPSYTQKRVENMRLQSVDESKLLVKILRAKRDDREFVTDDAGKKIKNKMFDKIIYETIDTYSVYDAKPEEVQTVIKSALLTASKK